MSIKKMLASKILLLCNIFSKGLCVIFAKRIGEAREGQ